MPQFYVVKGIGGGFDGLVVEGAALKDLPPTVQVLKLIDRDSIVGDRNISLPIPPGALTIGLEFLDPIDDPGIREFAATNPFGKLLLEGRMDCGDLQVVYAQYENTLGVVVTDIVAKKTVLSQYFSKDFDKVKAVIEDVLKNSQVADDLVFKLRELKEAENNG